MTMAEIDHFIGKLVISRSQWAGREWLRYGVIVDPDEIDTAVAKDVLWAWWGDSVEAAIKNYESLQQFDFRPIALAGKLTYAQPEVCMAFTEVDMPKRAF